MTFSTVKDRSQPIRSAITVAGMSGQAASNSRIRGSAASATDPFAGRTYFGGPSAASARRTVFRPIPSFRAIARTGMPSARCNRRISAQSSTLITPYYQGEGVHFQPPAPVQDSPADDDLKSDLHFAIAPA